MLHLNIKVVRKFKPTLVRPCKFPQPLSLEEKNAMGEGNSAKLKRNIKARRHQMTRKDLPEFKLIRFILVVISCINHFGTTAIPMYLCLYVCIETCRQRQMQWYRSKKYVSSFHSVASHDINISHLVFLLRPEHIDLLTQAKDDFHSSCVTEVRLVGIDTQTCLATTRPFIYRQSIARTDGAAILYNGWLNAAKLTNKRQLA